jgi:hypothetical protein
MMMHGLTNPKDMELLSYVRGFIIGKISIAVFKQYPDTLVSKNPNFKPEGNCMSPLGQAPRDRPVSTQLL